MESFIGLDRNGEFDDRRVDIDRGEGFGIGLAREEGGPANRRQVGGGAALLHLSQPETVAGILGAELPVRRAPLGNRKHVTQGKRGSVQGDTGGRRLLKQTTKDPSPTRYSTR